jgi:hypothetical protein
MKYTEFKTRVSDHKELINAIKSNKNTFFYRHFFWTNFVPFIYNKILCPEVSRYLILIVKSISNLDLTTDTLSNVWGAKNQIISITFIVSL